MNINMYIKISIVAATIFVGGFFSGLYYAISISKTGFELFAAKIYVIETGYLEEDYRQGNSLEMRIKALNRHLRIQEELDEVLVNFVGADSVTFDRAAVNARLAMLYNQKGDKGLSTRHTANALELFKELNRNFTDTEELFEYVKTIDKAL